MDLKRLTPEKITEWLENIIPEKVVLVDVAAGFYRKDFRIRVLIDKPGDVTVNDCRKVISGLKKRLTEEGVDTDNIHIEASSPPPEWPLTTQSDFERHMDKSVRISYSGDDADKTHTAEGIIAGCSEKVVTIKSKKKTTEIPLEKIIKGKILFKL